MTEWNYDLSDMPKDDKFLGLWGEDEVHLVMFYEGSLVIAEGGLDGIEMPRAWAPLPRITQ